MPKVDWTRNPSVVCDSKQTLAEIRASIDTLPKAPAYAVLWDEEYNEATVIALVTGHFFDCDSTPSGGISIIVNPEVLADVIKDNVPGKDAFSICFT